MRDVNVLVPYLAHHMLVYSGPSRKADRRQRMALCRLFLPHPAMKITFTSTWKDVWRCHPSAEFRNPLPLLIRLLWLPLLSFCVCSMSGLRLAPSLIICAGIWLFPLVPWGIITVPMIRDIKRLGNGRERVAEIRKFNFRWGTPNTEGYYYHWSNFSEILETSQDVVLISTRGSQFVILKAVFCSRSEAQQFFSQACSCWEAAKQRQQEQEAEEVWPPAPRQ